MGFPLENSARCPVSALFQEHLLQWGGAPIHRGLRSAHGYIASGRTDHHVRHVAFHLVFPGPPVTKRFFRADLAEIIQRRPRSNDANSFEYYVHYVDCNPTPVSLQGLRHCSRCRVISQITSDWMSGLHRTGCWKIRSRRRPAARPHQRWTRRFGRDVNAASMCSVESDCGLAASRRQGRGLQERSFTRHLKRKSSSLDESGIVHAG